MIGSPLLAALALLSAPSIQASNPLTRIAFERGNSIKDPSIYRMSVAGHGKDRKRLVKGGRLPSANAAATK
jgi:hypothetical protein